MKQIKAEIQKEKPSEDLEKAAKSHIRKVVDAAGHPGWDWEAQDVLDAFIAGAQWQKEQMEKRASAALSGVGITLADLVAYDKGVAEGKRMERAETKEIQR